MTSAIGTLEIVGACLFALAVVHTFSTRYFEHLAHTRTAHAGVWHLLGEVEAVFGFWAFVLIVFMALAGKSLAFVLFIALVGFFLYAMRPVLQAWAVEATPKELAGSGVGLQFGIQHVGAAAAPAIFGMIADASDIYTAFFFLAGTILFANVLIFFMPKENGRQAKPAAA